MERQPALDFNIGLSEQEKRDLEQLIGEFQTERSERSRNAPANNIAEIQKQIDAINKRLVFLTNMFLTLDRRIKPLYETIRLNFQKSEILNQRISMLIESMRTGESI
jgi:hypothetical protein